MNEATIIAELRAVHKRCDDLSAAINAQTDYMSWLILRERAYTNVINRSWVLTRFVPSHVIESEMIAINEKEGQLKQAAEIRLQQMVKDEEDRRKHEVLEKKVSKREAEAEKLQRKQHRGKDGEK